MSVPSDWTDEFLLYTVRKMKPPRGYHWAVVMELADRFQISRRRVKELEQEVQVVEQVLIDEGWRPPGIPDRPL